MEVEIISATECKSINPLDDYSSPLKEWKKAEAERKVYRIINDYSIDIGYIRKAKVNNENLTAIIL